MATLLVSSHSRADSSIIMLSILMDWEGIYSIYWLVFFCREIFGLAFLAAKKAFSFLLIIFWDCWPEKFIALIESVSEPWFKMSFSLLILIDLAFSSLDIKVYWSWSSEALISRFGLFLFLVVPDGKGEASFSFCMYDWVWSNTLL